MTQRMFAAVVLGLFLGISGPAKAQYHFTTYDVPGSTRTAVNGNSPHAIAGEFDDADGNTHGFVLSNGVFTEIDVPAQQSLPASTGSMRTASSQESTSMPAARSTAISEARRASSRRSPARRGPHAGRVPQRARRGRGSLPRCKGPDASRLHLEQGCLHHVRRARLGATARDGGLRDQRPRRGRGRLRNR